MSTQSPESFLPKAVVCLAFVAGGAGFAAMSEAVTLNPVLAERQTLPAATRPEEIIVSDTNGQLFDGPDPEKLPNKRDNRAVKMYSSRRSYGRTGQIGNRSRGDIQAFWYR